MSGWSYGIIGLVVASIVWMPVVWWILNQRDDARRATDYWREFRVGSSSRGYTSTDNLMGAPVPSYSSTGGSPPRRDTDQGT